MNIQLPHAAFQSEQQQRAQAADIRKRLMGRPGKASSGGAANAQIAELTAEIDRLEQENGRLVATVSSLELDLADIRASFMSQAKHLADLEDKIAGQVSYQFQEKKSVTSIVMAVLQDFPGVTWEDVLSPRRSRGLIKPRHACIVAVCEQRPDLSFPAVGKIFHRDHTTILHAVYGRKRNAARVDSEEA